jgi:hypothetical protein
MGLILGSMDGRKIIGEHPQKNQLKMRNYGGPLMS